MRVDIDGAAELVNRLVKFDKDVYKILERELAVLAVGVDHLLVARPHLR